MSSSKTAAERIWEDLTNRSGFDIDIGTDIIDEIIEDWQTIIDEEWGVK